MTYTSKADFDETVYVMKSNKIEQCEVKTIVIKQYTADITTIEYKLRNSKGTLYAEFFSEEFIFLTKDELIKELLS